MKDFIRNMDSVGRLVIPIELCRAHGIEKSQPVVFLNTPDGILIKAASGRCMMCGGSERLLEVGSMIVCETCTTRSVIAMRAKYAESIGKAAL